MFSPVSGDFKSVDIEEGPAVKKTESDININDQINKYDHLDLDLDDNDKKIDADSQLQKNQVYAKE